MGKKTAIIHDWLNGMRGGEKVLEELLKIFPEADIFTLFLERDKISEQIKDHRIFTSSLDRFGFIKKRYRHFLPLFPAAIEEFDLGRYEIIVSSSHCVAKGIIPFPGSIHISYLHSPMRYAWDQYYSYFGNLRGFRKSFIRNRVSKLRQWDVTSSNRVDHFIANSNLVKERIWKYYRRESEVIFPPVDTDFFTPREKSRDDFFLTVSALVPYKRVDLLIDAFNKTGKDLIVVGKGPEEKPLKKIAGNNIEFKKDLSGEDLKKLFQKCRAFVYAGIEDFGITFAEAHSCGTPVISYKKGGVLDIVNDTNGILFDDQSMNGIIDALEKIDTMKFNQNKIRESAERFSRENFRKNFSGFIKDKL